MTSGNVILQQIAEVKQEMLSDLSYYQSCATTGEYMYAAFNKDYKLFYQKLTDIEHAVVFCVNLIVETRNASIGLFAVALNDSRRSKDDGLETIRLYFYNLYLQGVAYQSKLTTIKNNLSSIDEDSPPCDPNSPEYDNCLNGILSYLQSAKTELTSFGTQVCATFHEPSSNGHDYSQSVFDGNTVAAKVIIDNLLTAYQITRTEIVAELEIGIQLSYDRSVSEYRLHAQYEAQLKQDMYRKLNTLKIMVAAVNKGIAGTQDNATAAALNALVANVNSVYTNQYNFVTNTLNAIDDFNFLGQLTEERDKVDAAHLRAQCNATSAAAEFFFCAQEMYVSFLSASDSIYSQYIALLYLEFPKDAPWWRIVYAVPPYINKALLSVPANSDLEKGLKCFRDYSIIYKTPEQVENQYNSCSLFF